MRLRNAIDNTAVTVAAGFRNDREVNHPFGVPVTKPPHFDIEEQRNEGVLRLALIGELDLASTPMLKQRLEELREEQAGVRLDLSRLEFMDSSGLRLLIRAIQNARHDGWQLDVDPNIPGHIMRVFQLCNVQTFILREGNSKYRR